MFIPKSSSNLRNVFVAIVSLGICWIAYGLWENSARAVSETLTEPPVAEESVRSMATPAPVADSESPAASMPPAETELDSGSPADLVTLDEAASPASSLVAMTTDPLPGEGETIQRDESASDQEETERQKEMRAEVEKERKARGATIKDLRTKLEEFERASNGRPLQLTFDDLVFDMKKGEKFERSMLSNDHNSLEQRRISIRGYIRPSSRQTGLTKFVFVRDNKECCFGPGAALFDCILVKLAKGQSTEYTVRPVTIEGDFYMKEFIGPNGKAWAIYRMSNGQVK